MGEQNTRVVVIRGNMNDRRYIDEVLDAEATPFMQMNAPLIFQQDNARQHVESITRDRLAAVDINVMQWPAMFPDMNPIEHIWDKLGRRVRRQLDLQNIYLLADALIMEWNNMPQRLIQRYVYSVRKRVYTLIRAKGGHNQ